MPCSIDRCLSLIALMSDRPFTNQPTLLGSYGRQAVQNVAICWKIPCIPHAAREGVGTISRKGSARRILRDYTPRPRRGRYQITEYRFQIGISWNLEPDSWNLHPKGDDIVRSLWRHRVPHNRAADKKQASAKLSASSFQLSGGQSAPRILWGSRWPAERNGSVD